MIGIESPDAKIYLQTPVGLGVYLNAKIVHKYFCSSSLKQLSFWSFSSLKELYSRCRWQR